MDLLNVATGNGLLRLSGSAGAGTLGAPVAGGFDLDNDGDLDFAMGRMQASPLGRSIAGQVDVVFGNGQIAQSIDAAVANSNVLTIIGDGVREATGAEIWMGEVTGDGIGDLLIGRPNYHATVPDRIGAGALTIIIGGQALRDLATNNTALDLRSPPANLRVVTITGAAALDRMGFWMRAGDITGDGVDDIIVGADQEDNGGAVNSGAAYVIRGGPHLDATLHVDLASFGSTALAGHILKIMPPPGSDEHHFAATNALGDLDNNGRAEILVASALNRAGGILYADGADPSTAVGKGNNPFGTAFIVWDDNIPATTSWPAGFEFSVDNAPMTVTRIDGGSVPGLFTNDKFGEELLGGRDYNNDGATDLFIGDLSGTGRSDRTLSGLGYVFFSAANLRNRNFTMSNIPVDLNVSTIIGPAAGTITSDTTLHGDIDNDGIDDLVIASPTASPMGREEAGIAHVIWGKAGPWPDVIDFEENSKPSPVDLRITEIFGAHGKMSNNDHGDTLMYSAASADMDGDGSDDLVINEMRGNGVDVGALDVGNLIIISGATVPKE